MARDLNKVMLIGRLTQDLEVKKLPESGRSVVTFSLATNSRYKTSEWNLVEEAEFHRCVAFGPLADVIGQYLSKGRKVYIEGRLRTRQWEDSTGNKRYTTEIAVTDLNFCDSKPTSSNSGTSEPTSPTEEEDIPF